MLKKTACETFWAIIEESCTREQIMKTCKRRRKPPPKFNIIYFRFARLTVLFTTAGGFNVT